MKVSTQGDKNGTECSVIMLCIDLTFAFLAQSLTPIPVASLLSRLNITEHWLCLTILWVLVPQQKQCPHSLNKELFMFVILLDAAHLQYFSTGLSRTLASCAVCRLAASCKLILPCQEDICTGPGELLYKARMQLSSDTVTRCWDGFRICWWQSLCLQD